MIRAHRIDATAHDDTSLVSGWNISPNLAYTLAVLPGPTSCGVLLYADNALVATGAALVGTDQPCVLLPQAGQTVEMVDIDFGWHLLLTTIGTETQREIRINPQVDLPDEAHPVYGDDDMALARATAAIDEAAHYRDDVTVSCPLGLGAGLGDMVSVPVDGAAVVGQVESITWAATPDGATEQAVIRRHVAIAPDAFVEPVLPTVADDTGTATHLAGTSGNVLTNDATGLTVVAVNGLSSNVGAAVDGDNGGSFTISADGSWVFAPDSDFDLLSGSETADTSVTYHASDGAAEAMATLTVTVSHANAAPVAVDDVGATTANATTSGNVLTNDTDADVDSLTVSQVAGSSANVGVAVAGSSGGLFTIASNGAWTFDPDGDFDSLTGAQAATTSVGYHVSDGIAEDEGLLTVTVSAAVVVAAIEFVGAVVAHSTNYPYTATLPEGVQPGDFVLAFHSHNNGSNAVMTVTTSGYTQLFDLYASDSRDCNVGLNYKIMGDPVDTDVSFSVVPAGGYGNSNIVAVFRNVDQTNPLDVTPAGAVGSNSAIPNPPAITPITPGALIVTAVNSACIEGVIWTPPEDYTVLATGDGYQNLTAIATKVWSGSGAEDPGAWSITSTTSDSWAAMTLALRPAS